MKDYYIAAQAATLRPRAQRYFVWIRSNGDNVEVVSPILTGGFNACCRWLYDHEPEIAPDCYICEVLNFTEEI